MAEQPENKTPTPDKGRRPWFPRSFKRSRYDFNGAGKNYIALIGLVYGVVVMVYAVAHWIFPPSGTTYAAYQFVEVNRFGQVSIKSAEDIEWFIGKEKAVPLLSAMDARNQKIEELRERVRTQLADLAARTGGELGDDIRAVIVAVERGTTVKWTPPAPTTATHCLMSKIRRWLRCEPKASEGDPGKWEATATVMTNLAARLKDTQTALDNNILANDKWLKWEQTVRPELESQLKELEAAFRQAREIISRRTNDNSLGLNNTLAALDAQIRALRFTIEEPTQLPKPNLDGRVAGELKRTHSELEAYFEDQLHPSESASVAYEAFATRCERKLAAAGVRTVAFEISSTLKRLEALRDEQLQAVQSLRQPVKFQIFWNTPAGIIFEILFWSFFGCAANLLFTASEYLRKPGLFTFSPVERWVGLTKMIYGPAVALALCLAITVGLINLMGESVRIWTMPIIAFFFGFNVRKTALVVDNVSKRLLDTADKSNRISPEERRAAQAAALAQIQSALPPVRSFEQLKEQAKEQARRLATQIVTRYEERI